MHPKYLISFLLLSVLAYGAIHPEAKLPFVDYCRYFKYPVQTHKVTTEDGYILTIFRIQRKASIIREGLKPILLQHGLLDSAEGWIVNDQSKSPAFLLANRNYDVWFGNSRGNKYSRNHTQLNPDKNKQFWQFTFQHMADHDIPAVLLYIHTLTKQKVHYLGHSQGTVQIHIALSKHNPVVEAVLDKYFAFGPIGVVKNANSNLVKLLDKSGLVEWFHIRKVYEFLPSFGWFQSDVGVVFCATFPKICNDFIGQMCDADPSLDNYQRYDVFIGHEPSGTSVLNMEHWKQAYDHGTFKAFDYGSAAQNNAQYGQPTPPVWNLSNIRMPVRLFAGASDELADPTDVKYLWDSLNPSAKSFFKTYNAGHVTFIWGLDVSPWMNDLFRMLEQ